MIDRSMALLVAALVALPGAAVAQGEDLIGVTRAVAAAEKALSGTAVDAELETKGGRLVYEVDVVRAGNLHQALVDARTGKLVSAEKRRAETYWRRWFDSESLNAAGRPLAKVLTALESETGGRVQEVSIESDGGRAFYEVELATSAGIAEVLIDPVTGKRLPIGLDD